MSDEAPKDELRARFQERTEQQEDSEDRAAEPEGADNAPNPSDTDDVQSTGETSTTQKASEASDKDTTRDRPQVPMYLPEDLREEFNALYKRLDARSTLAEQGGLEKHKDFMEGLVRFALDHEDEIAEQLGVPVEDE